MSSGFVTLVGAGPGRAEFLTIAGFKALRQAEVICYDALLSTDMRLLFPRKAKLVYVGKRCGHHAFTQEEINGILVSHARAGKQVVRLKGGDPFIFGRGFEEVLSLRTAGIAYRVIPGVSALNGVAADVTLPLTYRSGSNEFRVIQGHRLPNNDTWWHDLAAYQGTIAIFMGFAKLEQILSKLINYGADQNLPMAIIGSGEIPELHVTHISAFLNAPIAVNTDGPVIVYLGQNAAYAVLNSDFQNQKGGDDERFAANFS